jgi:hypothetical protein
MRARVNMRVGAHVTMRVTMRASVHVHGLLCGDVDMRMHARSRVHHVHIRMHVRVDDRVTGDLAQASERTVIFTRLFR